MLTDSSSPGPAIPATNSQASGSNIRTFSPCPGMDMIPVRQNKESYVHKAGAASKVPRAPFSCHIDYITQNLPDFNGLFCLCGGN